MRDPYTVLGVSPTASESDIKKAFRRLAKTHHPDRNAGDAKAKERFAELNAAYEIVGDKEKRGKFDRGEIDAEGKPRFQGFEGFHPGAGGGDPRGGFDFGFGQPGGGRRGGGTAEDIFSRIFGEAAERQAHSQARNRQARGDDLQAEIPISLEEAVNGAKRRLRLPTGRELEVTVPAGVAEGKVIRLKGQGESGFFNGVDGDALLTVRYQPHPRFKIEDGQLRLRQPVPLQSAVLGGPVRVETLDGAVDVTIPPMSSSGRTLRLRGKGIPGDKGRGDLLVTVEIMLPEGGDPELEALMRKRA